MTRNDDDPMNYPPLEIGDSDDGERRGRGESGICLRSDDYFDPKCDLRLVVVSLWRQLLFEYKFDQVCPLSTSYTFVKYLVDIRAYEAN